MSLCFRQYNLISVTLSLHLKQKRQRKPKIRSFYKDQMGTQKAENF